MCYSTQDLISSLSASDVWVLCGSWDTVTFLKLSDRIHTSVLMIIFYSTHSCVQLHFYCKLVTIITAAKNTIKI